MFLLVVIDLVQEYITAYFLSFCLLLLLLLLLFNFYILILALLHRSNIKKDVISD